MSATNQAEQTALTLPQRAAVALGESANAAKLRELAAQSSGIVSVTNADGREEAHRAGMVLLKTRTGIRATGKAARDDATKFSKAVIAMEDELIGIIEPEETRVLSLRDAWDEKIAAEKAALIAAERQRVDAIQAMIQKIGFYPAALAGKSSAEIQGWLDTENPDKNFDFMEFSDKAADAIAESLIIIRDMFAKAKASEAAALAAEEARKAEAARLEAEKAELAHQRAENERIANEQAVTAKRLADQEAAQALAARQLADKAAANLKAERDAQELAMRLEREKAAKEQAERDRVAADTKRQLDEQQTAIAADRAALVREQEEVAARAEAAVKLESDRAEALADNATFDAAMTRLAAVDTPVFTRPDDLTRCNATAAAFHDRHAASVEAYADAGLDDPELTDEEIIAFGAECGLSLPELVARMEAFTVYARAELLP